MRLPKNFPDGTRYVVETHGAVIRRYVVFPSGRKINLSNRKAVRYACREFQRQRRRGPETYAPLLQRRIFA